MTVTLEPRRTLLGSSGFALENIVPDALQDGTTCMVLSEGAVYRFDKFSTAAVTPPRVIATLRGAKFPGRWISMSVQPNAVLATSAELYLVTNRGKARIYGYESGILVDGYDGPPSTMIATPPDISGVGHNLTVLPNADLVLSTSESVTAPIPGNYSENFFYIPAGLTGQLTESQVSYVNSGLLFGPVDAGARTVAMFPDGTLLLSRGGRVSARPTVAELRGVPDIAQTPIWQNTNGDAAMGWDCLVDPGADKHVVWHLGYNSLYRQDLDEEPGPFAPDKIAVSANIGTAGWGGNIARDRLGNVFITRSDHSDVVVFEEAQLDALTSVPSSISPVRTIRTQAWDAIDTNRECIWGIAMTKEQGAYISTYVYGEPLPAFRVFYLDPDAMAGNGEQSIAKTIYGPAVAINQIRTGVGYGVYLR